MYEAFSSSARNVLKAADAEAGNLSHAQCDPEHLLLGLLQVKAGGAWLFLSVLGVKYEGVLAEVMRQHEPGPERVYMGKLPHTEPARLAISCAIEEAHTRRSKVMTIDLLAGLLRLPNGVATEILSVQRIPLERVRELVQYFTDPPEEVYPLRAE